MFLKMHRFAKVITLLWLSFLTCLPGVLADEQPLDAANGQSSARTLESDIATQQPAKTSERGIQPGAIGDQGQDQGQGTINSAAGSMVSGTAASKAESNHAEKSDRMLADAQAPTNNAGQKPGSPLTKSDKPNKLVNVLKSNIVQTFELDPRLKKDLTEGDKLLRPIKLLQDYCAVGYNPSITWERDNGPPWITSYTKNAMALYAAGPLTKHVSMWLQPLPLANSKGLANWFELCQGLANYGTDKTFIQVLGGQGFGWENIGFGGADRTITQTVPGVYTAINGFDPTATSKIISLSATGMNWTTGKVFGYFQPGASTSSDPNITYNRGYGVGLSVEKLLGKTGISGIQSNLTIGDTPAYNANTGPSGNPIGRQSGPFVWWTSWINRSFQDRKGYVRFNPSFGLTVFQQRRNLDNPNIEGMVTSGCGYTIDLVTIPVTSYWTSIFRFDDFRMDNRTPNNTLYTFTVGQAFDFHGPNKSRARVTFDYQLIGQHTAAASQRLILGFWPIW